MPPFGWSCYYITAETENLAFGVCLCMLERVRFLTELQQNQRIPAAIFTLPVQCFPIIDSVHFYSMVGAVKFPL